MLYFLILLILFTSSVVIFLFYKENKRLSGQNIKYKSDLVNLQKYFEEYKQDKDNLRMVFQNLSNDIIQNQNKIMSEEQKKTLEFVLDPFKNKLNDFQQKIDILHRDGISNKVSFEEQFKTLLKLNENLSIDAKNLTDALKNNKKLQGDWGEFQLEQILELSGLQREVHYTYQQNFKTEDGKNIRPDFIVKLPDNRTVVIDSKVSLHDYIEYMKSEDDDMRKMYLRKHASCIKDHMKRLSSKDYQINIQKNNDITSLDYVVMFLPYESAYVDAIKTDKDIYSLMAEEQVVIATPSSLFPILKTVENLWKLDKQNKNVTEIAKIGGDLYNKFVAFNEDMQKIENNILSAHKSYKDAYDKINSPRGAMYLADKLKKLGAKTNKTIELPVGDNS